MILYYIQCFNFNVSDETKAKMTQFDDEGKSFPKDLNDEQFIELSNESFEVGELIARLNDETAPTGANGYFRLINTK